MDQQKKILKIYEKFKAKITAIRQQLMADKKQQITNETDKQISDIQSKIKNL